MNTILSLLKPRVFSTINNLRTDNKKNHWMRIFMFGAAGIVFWAGTFIIIYRVLFYFQSVQDFGDILAMKLLSMIIMTFFVLLLFSSIINCLSHLYLSQDLQLLHSLPVSSKDIFLSRWLVSTFDSSWMVVAFSLPAFLSYGLIYKAGIIFYTIVLVAIIFMCLIASALGGHFSSIWSYDTARRKNQDDSYNPWVHSGATACFRFAFNKTGTTGQSG